MVVFPNCWVSLCRRAAHRKRADDEPPFMLFVRRVNPLWGKADMVDSARCPLRQAGGPNSVQECGQFKNAGFEGFSSKELGDFIKAQLALGGKMIKDANIQLK